MRRVTGFTLIELMITVAVIAILAAIAYPSYQDYIRRGIRSAGQQYLMDLAQRQEQFFLDRRQYTSLVGPGLDIDLPLPGEILNRYQNPGVVVTGPPPGFTLTLTPVAGSIMALDGTLIANNLQRNFRDLNSNGTYQAGTDKLWTER